MTEDELDVRQLRKPDKHPAIFAAYAELVVGESFVLVNDHEPKHLRDEFEVEQPGSHLWEYIQQGPDAWRIRITKLASTSLPRVLVNTMPVAGSDHDAAGAIWKLQPTARDLDSNLIQLPPHGGIDTYVGPDLDVLVHVVQGTGRLDTELGAVDLEPGAVVWLPRQSHRAFAAGPDGLTYLTVHRRRLAFVLDAWRSRAH
ncbi:MAG: DUF2249 domain-containing protein [Mycobacteriales bacterium]